MGAAQSALESAVTLCTARLHVVGPGSGCLAPLSFTRPVCSHTLTLLVLRWFVRCTPHCASPCIRCLKPFSPSADDLRQAAGYQPVSQQPNSLSHTASQPHANTAAADSADDTADWEDFQDYDDEQDRIERGGGSAQAAAEGAHTASLAAASTSSRSTSSSSASDSNHSSTAASPVPTLTPPRLNPSPPLPPPRPSPPPAIDFFGSLGIASSGYQEPVRLQTKAKPQASAPPQQSPTLTAAQRADVMRNLGLDDVGVEVASWDDGLELQVGETASKGKRGVKGDKKKKGLGAVVMNDV